MEKKYVMAFDEGTTGCRSIIFDHEGNEITSAYQEFTQYYPKAGWVEHDALEIWNAQYGTAQRAISTANIDPDEIAAIGITNQRETTVVPMVFMLSLHLQDFLHLIGIRMHAVRFWD